MRTGIVIGSHKVQLPFPFLRLMALFLAVLLLIAIGYLLRALIRLHRHTGDALIKGHAPDAEHHFHGEHTGTE